MAKEKTSALAKEQTLATLSVTEWHNSHSIHCHIAILDRFQKNNIRYIYSSSTYCLCTTTPSPGSQIQCPPMNWQHIMPSIHSCPDPPNNHLLWGRTSSLHRRAVDTILSLPSSFRSHFFIHKISEHAPLKTLHFGVRCINTCKYTERTYVRTYSRSMSTWRHHDHQSLPEDMTRCLRLSQECHTQTFRDLSF